VGLRRQGRFPAGFGVQTDRPIMAAIAGRERNRKPPRGKYFFRNQRIICAVPGHMGAMQTTAFHPQKTSPVRDRRGFALIQDRIS
jgi:hypothetical protein